MSRYVDADKQDEIRPVHYTGLDARHPKTLAAAMNPVLANARRQYEWQRENNEPLHGTAPEFMPPACRRCHDTGQVRLELDGSFAGYRPCPGEQMNGCAFQARRAAEIGAAINKRWPISPFELELATMEWQDERPGAPGAKVAREQQQAFMEQMPSARTLFLFGPPGVGKTRLLSEVAVVARPRGLSSILRSADHIRRILQDFPHKNDEDGVRAYKQRRLDVAWSDLTTADVLCIDEVDHAAGGAIYENLLELLNRRIAAGKSTAIAGNEGIERLGGPVISRLTARGNFAANLQGDSDARRVMGHGILQEAS